jgi:hypothetical protein
MQVLIAIVMSFSFLSGYGQKETQPDWAELRPILKQLNLTSTEDRINRYRALYEIEEADAKAYGPVSGVTLFLNAAPLTDDSGESKPRYWMRVEDYSTSEAASKRATEYY